MDLQQILAIVIVAGAAFAVARKVFGRKKAKSPACANCECGSEGKAAAGRPPSSVARGPLKQ